MNGLRADSGIGSRGMTLIEMLVVVVILGILISFAMPQIDLTRYRLNTAMHSVGSTLLAAQRRAVTRQHDVIVMFDQANSLVRIHEDTDNNGNQDTGERVRNYPLGDNVVFALLGAPARPFGATAITFTQMSGGLPAVTFHRNGSASEYGGFYITSRRSQLGANRPKDQRAVEIERATGRASWFHYIPPSWSRGF